MIGLTDPPFLPPLPERCKDCPALLSENYGGTREDQCVKCCQEEKEAAA